MFDAGGWQESRRGPGRPLQGFVGVGELQHDSELCFIMGLSADRSQACTECFGRAAAAARVRRCVGALSVGVCPGVPPFRALDIYHRGYHAERVLAIEQQDRLAIAGPDAGAAGHPAVLDHGGEAENAASSGHGVRSFVSRTAEELGRVAGRRAMLSFGG